MRNKKTTKILLMILAVLALLLGLMVWTLADTTAPEETEPSQTEEMSETIKKQTEAPTEGTEATEMTEPSEEATEEPTEPVATESKPQVQVQGGVVESDETIPDVPDGDDKPVESTQPPVKETEPKETKPKGEQSIGPDMSTSYEEYEAMSGEEQTMFYYSFSSADAFVSWYNAAKAEYEANIDREYIGADGVIDIGSEG